MLGFFASTSAGTCAAIFRPFASPRPFAFIKLWSEASLHPFRVLVTLLLQWNALARKLAGRPAA
uniref:Uncharacterized protein n=1 Tax=mine drainage metagenome TaxID=410659 RepID=E6QNB7_9ZZZZ